MLLLLGTGCESRSFKAQRALWRANFLFQKISQNPFAISEYEVNKAIAAYRKIIDDFSDNPSAVVLAQKGIGYIYLVKKQYQSARKEFSKLLKNCDEKNNICSDAEFLIGRTFEMEGNWQEAEKVYKTIINSYPLTIRGLQMPFYLINKHRMAKEILEMKASVHNAIEHYSRLLNSQQNNHGLALLLTKLIAQCYLLGEDWPNFIKTLDALIDKFSLDKQSISNILLTKALVYERELKDRDAAASIFQKIQTDYPNTRGADIAKEYLKRQEKEIKENK